MKERVSVIRKVQDQPLNININLFFSVVYFKGKLESRCKDLGPSLLVDGAVIDMERPYAAIPTLAERLKPGKSAVIYVANITQVNYQTRTP